MGFDLEKIRTFSTKSGVYLMKNQKGEVLYVGKAKNLRSRIASYYHAEQEERRTIPYLLQQVDVIDTIVLSSEKEALLLENTLIKRHRPKYNVLLKDDKSFIALCLTRHKWPRIDIIRFRGKVGSEGQYFGPYPEVSAARNTVELIHRLFPLRQCSDWEFVKRNRPCILYDMNRCLAPCVNECTKEEYDELVRQVERFLKGQYKDVVRELSEERKIYSEKLEFEKANEKHQLIQDVLKTMEKQNVEHLKETNIDVLALFREDERATLYQMFFRHGGLIGGRHHNFSKVLETDEELIQSFLLQYYINPIHTLPQKILVPLFLKDTKLIEECLFFSRKQATKIIVPKKGKNKAVLRIAMVNAETAFKKGRDEALALQKILLEMQECFHLSNYPHTIECVDISHLGGEGTVASLVSFVEGRKAKGRYRRFQIRGEKKADDYAAVEEVVRRHLHRTLKEGDFPDLLMIDGGKAHLSVALKVLKELNIASMDIIAFAKEKGRHDKGVTLERIYLLGRDEPLFLSPHSPLLFFLQRIRDEAHRSALWYQRKKRSMALKRSSLEDISGIGPVKRRHLMSHFGSVKKLLESSNEELKKVPSLTQKDVLVVWEWIQKEKK